MNHNLHQDVNRISMKSNVKIPRRSFLKCIGCFTGLLPTIVSPEILGAGNTTSPSNRVCVGLIGCGAMGKGHLRRLAGDSAFELLALCDVDKLRRDECMDILKSIYATRTNTDAWKGLNDYNDYREILIRKDIDAVVIVTPDHWHSLMAIEAARAGKDIYCEKPVSLTVQEGRLMVNSVKKYGRVFQTGSQYRSIPTIRKVCEFVRKGGLGSKIRAFTILDKLKGFLMAKRFDPYAQYIDRAKNGELYYPTEFDLPGEPVPEGLDWDLWVGPAPAHSYNKLYHENPSPGVVPWSFCQSFGAAANTWHLSHSADVIQYALGLEESGPIEIIHPSDGVFPTLTFKYANGKHLHFVDNWDMVKKLYKAVPSHARLEGLFGGVFVGENGWLTSMSGSGPIEGEPQTIFEQLNLKSREVNIGSNNHHSNWLDCIKTRNKPSSHEEIGHRSASVGHLAMISYRLKQSLKWDPEKEVFIDNPEANALLQRTFRKPFNLE